MLEADSGVLNQLCSVEHRTFQMRVTEVEVTEQAVGEVQLVRPSAPWSHSR